MVHENLTCRDFVTYIYLENCRKLRIEVSTTAFRTETLTFSSMTAVVMTHTLERSRSKITRFKSYSRNGRTEAITYCITSRVNAVDNVALPSLDGWTCVTQRPNCGQYMLSYGPLFTSTVASQQRSSVRTGNALDSAHCL